MIRFGRKVSSNVDESSVGVGVGTKEQKLSVADYYADCSQCFFKWQFVKLHFQLRKITKRNLLTLCEELNLTGISQLCNRELLEYLFASICYSSVSPPDIGNVDYLSKITRQFLADENAGARAGPSAVVLPTKETMLLADIKGLLAKKVLTPEEVRKFYLKDAFKFVLLTLHNCPRNFFPLLSSACVGYDMEESGKFIYAYLLYNLQIFGVRELDLLVISYL